MPNLSPLTIRQLAKLAGVSRSTVSLAMHNDPRISESTRNRVRQIAQENDYKPDPIVSTLMNQLRVSRKHRSVEKLAYVTFWPTEEGWRERSIWVQWFEGACARAESLGYEIEHIWAREPGMTSSRLSRILYTRAIRGVLISPLLRPRGHVSLNWKHLAAATIAHSIVKPELHRASHFHFSGMMTAARRLRQLGYQRIGFANLIDQVERVKHGWLASYYIFNLERPPARQVPALLEKTWNKKRFAAWLDEHRPDAVISSGDEPLRFLKELGREVPGEVAYANLDVTLTPNDWAGIDQQPRLVAAAVVDLVIGQLQSNEFGLPACAKTVNLDGIWREGSTAGKR